MEIYKWKWMVLDALECMNNADLKKKKKHIKGQHCARFVYYYLFIFQKLRHVKVI